MRIVRSIGTVSDCLSPNPPDFGAIKTDSRCQATLEKKHVTGGKLMCGFRTVFYSLKIIFFCINFSFAGKYQTLPAEGCGPPLGWGTWKLVRGDRVARKKCAHQSETCWNCIFTHPWTGKSSAEGRKVEGGVAVSVATGKMVRCWDNTSKLNSEAENLQQNRRKYLILMLSTLHRRDWVSWEGKFRVSAVTIDTKWEESNELCLLLYKKVAREAEKCTTNGRKKNPHFHVGNAARGSRKSWLAWNGD